MSLPSESSLTVGTKPSTPARPRRRKRGALIAITIVAILVLAAIGYMLLVRKEQHSFTVFQGTNTYTDHHASGATISNSSWEWKTDTKYFIGEEIDFWFKLHNNHGGTTVLAAASTDTPGFSFSRSSPALPVTLPNTNDSNDGVQVTVWFSTPSAPYTGPFHLIMHYDRYPSAEYNDISSVTETQVVTTHYSGGTTVERVDVQHPELAHDYRAGTMMTFGETYQDEGEGRYNITSIVANTTGFGFVSCSPPLPLEVPNATQPPLLLSMSFSVPSSRYEGPFSYIVFIDRYLDSPGPGSHHLTSICEVQYVTTYLGAIGSTHRYYQWHNGTAGYYPAGEAFSITEPYWNSGGSGTMSITAIVANTTGFTVASIAPQLPVPMPNSADGSTNITVVMSFATPVAQYIGPFEYTVYMDNHL